MMLFVLTTTLVSAETIQLEQISSDQIMVHIDGAHFTTWNCGEMLDSVYLNKPVLWPVLTSKGTPITRDFPFRKGRIEERQDHPHHQGIFFTYGLLNYGEEDSINVWGISKPGTENHTRYGQSAGKIINQKNTIIQEGKSLGSLKATNDWFSHAAQKTFLTEDRTMIFGSDSNSRYIDFIFRFIAKDKPVTWVDSKEGMFAIRLTPALLEARKNDTSDQTIKPGSARYINAYGEELEKGVWGKRSPWLALKGILETGELLTVIIIDHPDNVNHPSFWHARGYGLFSINPFGLHDFTRGKQNFNFKLPAGGSLTLKYRMLFYEGHPDKTKLENLFSDYVRK
jgi:hypothetical protein